jgi:hypothetical protein
VIQSCARFRDPLQALGKVKDILPAPKDGGLTEKLDTHIVPALAYDHNGALHLKNDG